MGVTYSFRYRTLRLVVHPSVGLRTWRILLGLRGPSRCPLVDREFLLRSFSSWRRGLDFAGLHRYRDYGSVVLGVGTRDHLEVLVLD